MYDPLEQRQLRVPEYPERPRRRDQVALVLGLFFFGVLCAMISFTVIIWWRLA